MYKIPTELENGDRLFGGIKNVLRFF